MNTNTRPVVHYNDQKVAPTADRRIEEKTEHSTAKTRPLYAPPTVEGGETLTSLLAETSTMPGSSLAIIQSIVDHSLAAIHPTLEKPLSKMIQTQRSALIALAQSWQALGAHAFTIWDDTLLFCWPQTAKTEIEQHSLKTQWSSLIVQGRTIGKLGIVGVSEQSGSALHLKLEAEATLIAQLVTLSINLENARTELIARNKLKMEMDVAASIQLQLLPHTFPKVRGLDIFAHSLPATQVGGDFYSFQMREQRPFIFAIGDVSGKGLPAAFLMAMTRIALHGAARFMPGIHPRAILSRINEDLYDDFTELGMFATIFTGCYDINSRRLSYANAGHSPVIYCPTGGSAVLLEADGPAAGVLPINLCENFALTFHPGDVLVAATDGFSEAANINGELFGYTRLLTQVEELAHLPAADIAATMHESIQQFASNCEQSDDQTLVILKGVEP